MALGEHGKKGKTFGEVTRIEGIVTSTGGVLGKNPAFIVMLRPWKDATGKVQRKQIRVEVPLENERGISRMMRTWDGKAVALSVETLSRAHGNFLERIAARSPLRRIEQGRDLNAVVEQQAKPRRVENRVIGVLKLDRGMGWYEGKRKTGKLAYGVCVDTPDPDDDSAVAKAVDEAGAIALRIERELPRIRDAIADELLDTYNDNWRESGRPLSAAAFKKRHELATLQVTKRRITLYFDCKGLFTDHVVEVRLSPRLAVREVCVSG
jgi:hypothetical protein